jgi:hypothetical protein
MSARCHPSPVSLLSYFRHRGIAAFLARRVRACASTFSFRARIGPRLLTFFGEQEPLPLMLKAGVSSRLYKVPLNDRI